MTDDLDTLSAEVGAALYSRGLALVTAESCTGGGIGEAITRTAGSSEWYERGFITYTYAAKREMLGVAASTLDGYGAVSEEAALEMVSGALVASRAGIALAVTGIAGPGGATDLKPAGMVCFAWARRDGVLRAETQVFSGNRGAVRGQAIRHALRGILLILK